MDEISAFWAGAQDFAEGLDLPAIATGAGGWGELEAWGVGEWVEAGLSADRAAGWVSSRPRRTLGVALTLEDPRYPPMLRQTTHPPAVLMVDGDPAVLSSPSVGIVGTRACTAYGASIAAQLAHAVASAGHTVVSGLARGIDAHAHRAALGAGRTVGVLAHGLRHTAPASNKRLRGRITSEGGAVVSTWPDDAEPRPWRFPKRNAWIAGLAHAVVVVEAGRRSGASITARAAAREGRDVYAVPGLLGLASAEGCHMLIRDGAGVVVSVRELVEVVCGDAPARWVDWLDALFHGATVDTVSRRFGRSVSELMSTLGEMELRGQVVRLPGQRYAPGGGPR